MLKFQHLGCFLPNTLCFDVPLTMHKSNWNKLRKVLKTRKKIEECGKQKTKLSGKRRRIRKCKSGLATNYEVFIQERHQLARVDAICRFTQITSDNFRKYRLTSEVLSNFIAKILSTVSCFSKYMIEFSLALVFLSHIILYRTMF